MVKNGKLIGITGGIATGKSTVSALLREKGYPVLDADQLVHRLQKKGGQLYNALLKQFGDAILQEDGELDRPKLAKIIFSNDYYEKQSAHVQDQIIRQALQAEMAALLKKHEVVFVDIPLLFEKNYQSDFDLIWLVSSPKEVQLSRLMRRNHLSKEAALQRIKAQLPLDFKKQRADFVIENDGDKEHLKQTIETYLEKRHQ